MLDLVDITTSTVAVLSSLLAKATEKGFEKAGEDVAGTLVNALKKRLNDRGIKDELEELTKNPGDVDTQAALRVQLRNALRREPSLATELQKLIGSVAPMTQSQVGTASHYSTVIQIQGSQNTVRAS